MIGIIDYGMGNLRSVQKAFEALDAQAEILTSPEQAPQVDRLVLPGVGAYADGMANLTRLGWPAAIRDFAATGKPLLGICLGMQLLVESSQEGAASPDEPVKGLGILPGRVVRFTCDAPPLRLKVPHMGWNTLRWDRPDPLLAGLPQDCAVYFVHSYYVTDVPDDVASAWCDYGGPFCATLWRDNIWATQFHPEKSQRVGLHMLRNFTQVDTLIGQA